MVDRAHVEARAAAGLSWIYMQPESKVAVVAHGALLISMLKILGVKIGRFPNCGILMLELELEVDGESRTHTHTRLLHTSFGDVSLWQLFAIGTFICLKT